MRTAEKNSFSFYQTLSKTIVSIYLTLRKISQEKISFYLALSLYAHG